MTVVAYKDGNLASDSLVIINDVRCGYISKITETPGGALAGAAGTSDDVTLFLNWAKQNFEPEAPAFDKEFEGLVVLPNWEIYYINQKGIRVPVDAPFVVLGSGGPVALGAMEMGASAFRAVEISILHNIGCGGPIQIVSLEG